MTTEIISIAALEQQLIALKNKYKEVPDVKTTHGYELCRLGIANLRDHWVGLEKYRKEESREAQSGINKRNASAKILDEKIRAIAAPLIEAKQSIDEAVALAKQENLRAEKERADALQMRVSAIHSAGADAYTVDELIAAVAEVESAWADEEHFFEFAGAAEVAKSTALDKLEGRLKSAQEAAEIVAANERMRLEQEAAAQKLAAQQAAMDAAQAEINERNRAIREQQEAEQAQINADKAKVEADRLAADKAKHDAIMLIAWNEAIMEQSDRDELDRIAREQKAEEQRIADDLAAKEQAKREEAEEKALRDKSLADAVANKKLFAADAKTLMWLSDNLIELSGNLESDIKLITVQGRSVLQSVIREIGVAVAAIKSSDVVRSQQ